MSSNWLALHAQLVRSVNRHSQIESFSMIFPGQFPPAGFREPSHLFGWLHAPGGDAEIRNRVLARLLGSAGSDAPCRMLAVELLILSLWPGLCVIRRRLRTPDRLSNLDADLLSGLSIAIGTADPMQVSRVAATLLRNLERDLRRQYQRDACLSVTALPIFVADVSAEEQTDRPEAILTAARTALGKDGALLTAIHVAGFSQKEVASVLGISHDASRKRCQRAMARVRQIPNG